MDKDGPFDEATGRLKALYDRMVDPNGSVNKIPVPLTFVDGWRLQEQGDVGKSR